MYFSVIKGDCINDVLAKKPLSYWAGLVQNAVSSAGEITRSEQAADLLKPSVLLCMLYFQSVVTEYFTKEIAANGTC